MFSPALLLSLGAVSLAACGQVPANISGSVARGQVIYAKECAQCHGVYGAASAGKGIAAPDLARLALNNGGSFSREFVQRFVMGLTDREAPDTVMPEFKNVGLRHVYPEGGADGEVLEADFEALLDLLASVQE